MNRPCRSALFVPATNERAMARARSADVDALIIDLEDAVAPEHKQAARAAALAALRQGDCKAPLRAVRINALSSDDGHADVLALAPEAPDALVVPKVESAEMLRKVRALMQRAGSGAGTAAPQLWAMVETPRGILNLESIARSTAQTGLTTLIAGSNDLARELGCDGLGEGRQALLAHLSRLVLIARCEGLGVLDGVYNAFADNEGFASEAAQGKRLGFDGKCLIHPAQIEPAHVAFGTDAAQIRRARAIVRAFALKKNAGKGAINLGGQMVERLHLYAAQALLDTMPAPAAKPASKRAKKAKPKS